jgi:hypothetical protein
MKITSIEAYTGPVDKDGLVPVYDITVEPQHLYSVAGVVVSNSKRIAMMDVNALQSHGAVETLRDAKLIKGQKNDQFWLNFMNGLRPPDPQEPFTYAKFIHQLKAAGIHVSRKGPQTHLMPLTNADADELVGDRRIKHGETVRFDHELRPIPGGLFDPQLTGGHNGRRWAGIDLPEPFPNPVMEEPIRHILGLTQKEFLGTISGEHELPGYGKGPKAIEKALGDINVDREITNAKQAYTHGRKSGRDAALRKWKYLRSAQDMGMTPKDWMLNKVPVLPPAFRPVSVMGGSGVPLVSDPNYLYKELMEATKNHAAMKNVVGEDGIGAERAAIYHSFKAVTGLGDPLHPKLQEKGVKGLLATIFGTSPKYGCYDDETEILSENGWVLFRDLVDGVKVATLNPQDGAFEWQEPTGVFHWDYSGELFWFGTKRGLDCVVTPNHRNWVRYRDQVGTDNIESGWRIERAYLTAATFNRKWFRTAASAWIGHRKRPKFLSKRCSLQDFAAFVGWWTAEGWLGDRKLDRIQLCQLVKSIAKCKEIDRLVRSLDMPFSVGQYVIKSSKGNTKVWQWSIHSKDLAEWLTANVRRGAGAKKLSAKIRDWDSPYLLKFLQAYLDGDGTRRYLPRRNDGGVTHKHSSDVLNRHQNAHTISEALAGDLQEITCKLGVTSRLRWIPGDSTRRSLCRVNMSGSRFVMMEGNKNHKVIDYTGQVHCVSVPNGIVYVRRNGKPFFSGNTVQRKLLSSTVDNVGRAVITPNPDYDLDTVGVPENQAFNVYSRFIARRLKRQGLPISEALRHIKDKTDLARSTLQEEMEERPVYINRAPVLHRFGIMAFRPQMIKGDVMQVSPLIVKGFGADFDGDAQYSHIICGFSTEVRDRFAYDNGVSIAAIEEHRMAARFKVTLPTADGVNFYIYHLEDFLHGKRVNTTEGQHGLIDWYEVPSGIKVLAMNDNGALAWSDVSLWTVHRDCPVQIVTLSSGRQIFTDDDPRAVFGIPAGTLQLQRATPAEALKKRFLVPRIQRCKGIENAEILEIQTEAIAPVRGNRGNALKPVLPLTGIFGYIIGVAAGDGWATTNECDFCVASITPEIVNRLDRFIPKLFAEQSPQRCSVVSHESYGQSERHTWTSVALNQLVSHLVRRGARCKQLPTWFLGAPANFRRGLFAGLMDTDGSISVSNAKKKPQLMANFSSTSLRLCQEVALLASSLGIRSRVTASKTPAGKPYWMLSFSNSDIKRWGGVGMVHPEKLAKLRSVEIEASGTQASTELVPVSAQLATAICKAIPTPGDRSLWPAGRNTVYTAFAHAKKNGYTTRETAKRVLDHVADPESITSHADWKFWQSLVESDQVTWDMVESVDISDNPQTGYDLTVPGCETFADINGVILSNTMQFHVPTTDEAVKEAYDRMMPSKNLISPGDFKTPMHMPGQEYLGGIYHSTKDHKDSKKRPRVFRNKADAIAAHKRGEISVDTPVEILEE